MKYVYYRTLVAGIGDYPIPVETFKLELVADRYADIKLVLED